MTSMDPRMPSIGPTPPSNGLPQDAKGDELVKLAGWDTIPLFMKELPEELNRPRLESNPTTINPSIEALQALIYDEDEDEKIKSVEALKARANELFSTRDYRQALGFYTQAIEIFQPSAAVAAGGNKQETHQISSLKVSEELASSIYSNRAACHLALGNCRSCLIDCETVLNKSLPTTPATKLVRKCLFRSAKALVGLERLDPAHECIEKLIAIDQRDGLADDPEPEKLKLDIQHQIAQRLKKKREAEQADERRKILEKALRVALQSRGVSIPLHCPWPPPESILPQGFEPAHFEELPSEINNATGLKKLDDGSSMVYPVYVLRPKDECPTRDLVLRWHEDDLMGDHLEALCGGIDGHHFYLITAKRKILKCGNKLSIRKIAKSISKGDSGDSLCLGDMGHLEFFLLPIGHLENEWIDETKKSFS